MIPIIAFLTVSLAAPIFNTNHGSTAVADYSRATAVADKGHYSRALSAEQISIGQTITGAIKGIAAHPEITKTTIEQIKAHPDQAKKIAKAAILNGADIIQLIHAFQGNLKVVAAIKEAAKEISADL